MDCTPPAPDPSIKASAAKLPIKRKSPVFFCPSPYRNPNPSPSSILAPKPNGGDEEEDDGFAGIAGGDGDQPPCKFHRIWNEPDEIQFLQGLLDCVSDGLSFPRDLHIFYARFSGTMSQPYTKSQLSEKLRRLRKKFQVISSRLARGLDKALLSSHDRSLFDLSEQLWNPKYAPRSPFGGGNSSNPKKSDLIGVKVSFSPTLPSPSTLIPTNHQPVTPVPEFHESNNADHYHIDDIRNTHDHVHSGDFGADDDAKLREVNIEFAGGLQEEGSQVLGRSSGSEGSEFDGDLGEVVAKTVINVFDESLKEVRMALVRQGLLYPAETGSAKEGKAADDFDRRWREQRVAELDVWAHRVRLVLEQSLLRR